MDCPRCAAAIPAGARYCTACGAALAPHAVASLAPDPARAFLSSTGRALLAVAFFAVALILVPLVLFSSSSLYTSQDGATLARDSQVGLFAGFLVAAATLGAILWAAPRVPKQGDLAIAALVGAGIGLVVAFGLGAEANDAAHADLVNGSTLSTPIFHMTLAVLLLGLAIAVAIALNASRAPPYLGFILLVAGGACIAVAALAYDGWLLQNSTALRNAAAARAHYRTPLPGWVALLALGAVAVALRARARR